MNERRRNLLAALGALSAGFGSVRGCDVPSSWAATVGSAAQSGATEPPPETTRIRIGKVASACLSPQYLAAELFRAEGFAHIEYVADGEIARGGVPASHALGEGRIDVFTNFAAPLAVAIDRGYPIVLLAGVHAGCFELVATRRIRRITDLKGKTVAVLGPGSAPHIFLASIATYVGLDPNRDINWSFKPIADSVEALVDERIDAMLAFPPDAQELRAKGVGNVLLNSAKDRPWSQYFCCLISANRDFVRHNPVAARRAVRAILKASDLCAADPDRAAQAYLGQRLATNERYVGQAMREVPFGTWRDYSPEDTMRFYALKLREAGMVKKSPQQLIAEGTDWTILERLRKEMKA
jgi:NitT/TauT family transport system substrate-binding protein